MPLTRYTYSTGSVLPDVAYWIKDGLTGQPFDFSSGWTFAAAVAPVSARYDTLTIASTISVTGSASTGPTDPNVVVAFTATNITQIKAAYETQYTAGVAITEDVRFFLLVTATRTSDGRTELLGIDDLPVFTLQPTAA